VPHDGLTIDEAGLRSYLKERLASYKVPRRILFFSEEDVAVTGSAKIKGGDMKDLATRTLRALEGDERA
jgi:fatty-acyl-CoA synthase